MLEIKHLADELAEASHWYKGTAELKAFSDHVRAGHGWTLRRPRQLLAWADRNRVPVFGHQRFLSVVNAGFDGPGRWRLWRTAVSELRQCQARIQCGEEDGLAYAGDHDLLSFGDAPPRRWGQPTDEFGSESAMTALTYPSFAGPAPEAAGTAPPGSSSGPQIPRGGWITRL